MKKFQPHSFYRFIIIRIYLTKSTDLDRIGIILKKRVRLEATNQTSK
jgi:hypothetical protein